MKILVLNCGSSSLKFRVLDIDPREIGVSEGLLARGLIEKIGKTVSVVSCTTEDGKSSRFEKPIPDYLAAIQSGFEFLQNSGVITSGAEIEGVGHRVVHGGERFRQSTLIDTDVERAIEECSELAPLHNPHNLKGYRAARELMPDIPHVAVFDTAFHLSLPPRAYLYGTPYEYYTKDKVRRYGFHGTSHRFVSSRFAQIQKTASQSWKMITCHLGNGCSLCAIDRGRSVDTSMGFTPLEGLIMGTRSGDVDAGAILYLMSRRRYTFDQIEEALNRESGLLGISGISNDMRDLLQQSELGSARASLAVDMFCYRTRKYLGAYLAALEGADVILFTGGIGENAPQIRAKTCEGLNSLGVILDPERNRSTVGIEGDIGGVKSRTKVWVLPTNEELLIARDTVKCIVGLPLD